MLIQKYGRLSQKIAACLTVLFIVLVLEYSQRSNGATGYFPRHGYSSLFKKIGNSSLGFEKIYVINGPWRTDRKDELTLAAAISDIRLDWIDGVRSSEIPERAYPPGKHREISKGNKGSWRAHMNALRTIVEEDISTALILEDDADWDLRIRSQLVDFSYAACNLPSLISEAERQSIAQMANSAKLSQVELAKRSSRPLTSFSKCSGSTAPFGNHWDVLWLGHCGAKLPAASPHSPNRIIQPNDLTVPQPRYLKPMARADLDNIATIYPPHTRVMHQANKTLCTIAYAVTQCGARKLLYEFGVKDFSQGFDFALSDWCSNAKNSAGNGLGNVKGTSPMCLTVQPPIFGHHFSEQGRSDIIGLSHGGKPPRETRYVRWSVRMNLQRLLGMGNQGAGKMEGMKDQWPDTEGV